MEKIAVLGSTGSVGTQALEVISDHPEKFKVTLLAAGSNIDVLVKQIDAYRPPYVYIDDKRACELLQSVSRHKDVLIFNEKKQLHDLLKSDQVNTVVAAIAGFEGLATVWSALQGKKKIALANKESLVTAGDLIMNYVKKYKLILKPVDSEHSAIFQCLEHSKRSVEKIILTASGGPFRELPFKKLKNITVEQALKHPTWKMGKKITIDSATLANKGLEVIEASHLFNLTYDQIEVIIHKESIIHSMVQFIDGAVLAQMGLADMKLPIQYALSSPYSFPNNYKRLDLTKTAGLHFESPRRQDFPALDLAYSAGREGQSAGLCYNTGNEVAVDLFLRGIIAFTDIPMVIRKALNQFSGLPIESVDHIYALDHEIRSNLYAQYERK